MILVSENSVADNGMGVQSAVHLFIDQIGIEKRPFRVDVIVDHETMFTARCTTEAEAKEDRARMHAAYLEAHATN